MSHTVDEVNRVIETLWPIAAAEAWDAPGLLSGDPAATVSHIHLAVDAVVDTADEAIEVGADLLLTHHPLLLRGVTSVAEDRYKGAVLARLIRASVALVAAHTNADVVDTGTSAVLASRLGLTGVTGLNGSIGRIGTLTSPVTLGKVAAALGEILPVTAGGIRVSGEFDHPVSTVALCGGAGDAYLADAAAAGVDVYITSDLRHHPASEFRETARLVGGPALIDVSHWASEWLWLDTAASELRDALPGVTVTVSDLRTDPWDFVVVQSHELGKV
jgi:dinuclear metal center YbgI/SA1388 family protein